MKKFLRKLALFALLLTPLFALPAGVLLLSGELIPVECVARAQFQGGRPIYFGCAYSEPAALLKLRGTQLRRPEVLALGTSRVLQFRSEFFKPAVNFYNAGLAIENLSDIREFIERLPRGSEPKVLIAGLDQRTFNPRDRSNSPGGIRATLADARSPRRILRTFTDNWRKLYADYRAGKIPLARLRAREDGVRRIGLRAVVDGDGFRNDGSYYYARNITGGLRNLDEGLHRIRNGGYRFDYGQEVAPGALVELRRLLDLCRERRIHLVAFLPPYAGVAYEELRATGRHGYIFAIEPLARPIFEQHGFTLHDFSNLGALGIPDTESYDVYHPTEKGTLRMFLRLLTLEPALAPYTDPDALQAALIRSSSDFYVFEN